LLQHAEFIQSDMQDTPKDTFSLYVAPSVNAYALKLSMRKLKKIHPTVHWALTADPKRASHQLISMQQLSEHQHWLELIQEDYYLLIPAGHDLAQRHQLNQTIDIEDLILLTWIERSHCEFAQEFNRLLAQTTQSMDMTAQVENEDWAISLVASGMGATIGPITPEQLDSDVYCIPLKAIKNAPPLTRKLGLASDIK
jgi:DNA-binding transcriptional LysR family regulator